MDKIKYWHGVSVNNSMYEWHLYWLNVFYIISYYEKIFKETWARTSGIMCMWSSYKSDSILKALGKDSVKYLQIRMEFSRVTLPGSI